MTNATMIVSSGYTGMSRREQRDGNSCKAKHTLPLLARSHVSRPLIVGTRSDAAGLRIPAACGRD
jgi:hypothetical protein